MSTFEAVVGPVDRLRGLALPDQLTLHALVLMKTPGPDGTDFRDTDIISDGATPIDFVLDCYRLLSLSATSLPLKTGSWPNAYLVLMDSDGEPFAFGAIRSADGAPAGGSLEAGKNKISIRNHQRA